MTTRLFLTSYQKSGTHQIMQALMHEIPAISDRSGMQGIGLRGYGFGKGPRPLERYKETVELLRNFPKGHVKAFGHVAYLPQYAEALRSKPTKVVFNIRDPRDVVVAEYMNLKRHIAQKFKGVGHMNLSRADGTRLIEREDPITELIEIASVRWNVWFGWLDEDFTTVVRYEDLRLDTRKECMRIQRKMAGCRLPAIDAMVSQARNTGWSHSFRKGNVGDWKTVFEPHHKKLSEEILTPVIERLGYA